MMRTETRAVATRFVKRRAEPEASLRAGCDIVQEVTGVSPKEPGAGAISTPGRITVRDPI